VRLVLENGEISRLLMEQIGLHVLEVVHLKLAGDKAVKLRCAVADFSVKRGVMQANALVLDTEVSTIAGTGSIDLAREKLDLTFVPKTRSTSPVALRTPIYITGSFSRPDIGLDKSRIAARSAGAILLGIVNPLLALIPLVEMGPGVRSECARLIQEAQSPG
jgi:AsmA protein